MILAQQDCGCSLPTEESASIVNSGVCSGIYLFMILLEGYLKGRCSIATPCTRVKSTDELYDSYDFIVVGAGVAGSIVAGRLSENSKFKVLLLEAGPDEPIGARVPAFYKVFWENQLVDWGFHTVPNKNFCRDQGDKGCTWVRAKVLGGCNTVNGLMYHRGHPADYDDWVQAGATGWSWKENYPYFLRSEGNKQIGSLVSAKLHSDAGPMPVQQFRYQPELVLDLMQAINSTGLPVINDLNDPENPEGFAIAQTMNADGQRYTTARAFLKPTSERPNFQLKLNAYVTKVIIREIDGQQKAVGVEYIDQNGNLQQVLATKEVILCGGSLKTPHILMLSGVGPKETLEKYNISVVADVPVGQNLLYQYGLTINFVLRKLENRRRLDWDALTEYLLKQDGPMSADGLTQVTGLLYSSIANKTKKQPDIQYFFNGLYPDCSRTGVIGEPVGSDAIYTNISVNVDAIQPKSVGYMTLQSNDPLQAPLFYPNFFSHPDDMVVLIDGVKYLKTIVDSEILKNKYGIQLDVKQNMCENAGPEWSDEWIECVARTHTDPQNHQVGTAAMGLVIDPELNVYAVNGLRVIDASSFPKIVTGNPQGAIMMIAERGAQFIKDKWQ